MNLDVRNISDFLGRSAAYLKVFTFQVGRLRCNCTVVSDPNGNGVIFDPGDNPQEIYDFLKQQKITPQAFFHTHAHFDHVGALGKLKLYFPQTPIYLHEGDKWLYDNVPMQARMFGINAPNLPPVDIWLEDGLQFKTQPISSEAAPTAAAAAAQPSAPVCVDALHTPGHTPGSCCFLIQGDVPLLISGDTLFHQSIGRTDLWGGNFDTLIGSIKNRLLTLDGDIKIIPGHGPETQVAFEKKHNPFLNS